MANASLQIGNGNWAIKEDNLLGYSKSGTRFLPIPITMTRATLGTRVNPSGLIEDVALLGSELVSCGDFACADPDAVWNRGTGWTISGGSANCDGSQSSQSNLYQTGIVPINISYKVTFTTTVSAGGVTLAIGGSNAQTITTESGTYTFTSKATSGDSNFYFSANSDFIGSISNVSVKEATIDGLARVDYTDGTGSLLVEPQRTNLVTYSQDTSQWTDSGMTYSVDYIISPDGTSNGSKAIINDTITSSNTRPMTSVAVTSGTNYVFSVFGKADEFDMINLDFSNSAFSSVSVDYNLTNGTVTSFTGSPVSQGVEDYGNGWYRCYVVATAIATTTTALIIRLDDNPTGDGTSGLYLWGAQAEAGSYPTSYIKTQGSSVTRNADLYEKTGISNLINSTEGVLFVEAKTIYDSSTSRRISLSDGSINNRVMLEFDETTENTIKAVITTGGVNSAIMTFAASDLSQYNKIAIKYKLNDFSIWFNGTEVVTDSSGGVPTGLTQLVLDGGDGSNFFYGEVKQLQVFKTALSDSELATLTT